MGIFPKTSHNVTMSRFAARQFLELAMPSSSIDCPVMRLLGRQGQPLVEGKGTVHLDQFGDFNFELIGKAGQPEELQKFITRHRSDPYDGLGRFRLVVETADGSELHCGFAVTDSMRIEADSIVECSGHMGGLSFDAPSLGEVGTEILILVPKRHWLSNVLSFNLPPANDQGVSTKSMSIYGSELEFEFSPTSHSLTIAVTGSDTFPQTYTEGWLSEPLIMMLGQLVFPRVIVRSNPDRAIVWVSQIRPWHTEADGFSLLDPAETFDRPKLFFELYSELLVFVASARDHSGRPNFERHPLTLFYEELSQAMRGSRWIMTMTLASAVEGALGLIFPADTRDESVKSDEIEDLKLHIDNWSGHKSSSELSVAMLRNKAKGAVSHAMTLTAIKRLRLLEGEGKIAKEEMAAWERVRNKVAHGRIFSPFSSAEDDQLIENLMSLFRKLSGLVTLGRSL